MMKLDAALTVGVLCSSCVDRWGQQQTRVSETPQKKKKRKQEVRESQHPEVDSDYCCVFSVYFGENREFSCSWRLQVKL